MNKPLGRVQQFLAEAFVATSVGVLVALVAFLALH